MERSSIHSSMDSDSGTTTTNDSTPRPLIINTNISNEKEYTASNPFAIFDQDKGQWKCGKCKRFFKARKDLEQHLNSGTHDEIKYNCSECNRGFASIGALTLHCEQAGHIHKNWSILQDVQTMLSVSPSKSAYNNGGYNHNGFGDGYMKNSFSGYEQSSQIMAQKMNNHINNMNEHTSMSMPVSRNVHMNNMNTMNNMHVSVRSGLGQSLYVPLRSPSMSVQSHIPPSINPPHYNRMNESVCRLHIAAFTERGCMKSGCALTLVNDNYTHIIYQDSFIINQNYVDSLQPEYDAIYEGLIQALDRGIVCLHVVTSLEIIYQQLNMNYQELIQLTETGIMDSFALKIRKLMLEFRFVDIELATPDVIRYELQRSRETYFQCQNRKIEKNSHFQQLNPVSVQNGGFNSLNSMTNISPIMNYHKQMTTNPATTTATTLPPTWNTTISNNDNSNINRVRTGIESSFGSHTSIATIDTSLSIAGLGHGMNYTTTSAGNIGLRPQSGNEHMPMSRNTHSLSPTNHHHHHQQQQNNGSYGNINSNINSNHMSINKYDDSTSIFISASSLPSPLKISTASHDMSTELVHTPTYTSNYTSPERRVFDSSTDSSTSSIGNHNQFFFSSSTSNGIDNSTNLFMDDTMTSTDLKNNSNCTFSIGGVVYDQSNFSYSTPTPAHTSSPSHISGTNNTINNTDMSLSMFSSLPIMPTNSSSNNNVDKHLSFFGPN